MWFGNSRFFIAVALSDSGSDSRTSAELQVHFVSQNPAFASKSRSWLANRIASSFESTDLRQPPTEKFLSSVRTVSMSNSTLWFSATHFRAKFAQLGDEVAPKRWTVIWYSSGGRARFPSGHHRDRSSSESLGFTQTWRNIAFYVAHERNGMLSKSCDNATREFIGHVVLQA